MADLATNNTIVAAYNPTTEVWSHVTLGVFIRHHQPFGWLLGTRRMIRDGDTPALPEARPTDDGTMSGDPDNIDGEQKAKLKVHAYDMRGKSSGAVETPGNWRINGTGQRVTGYLRAKDNGRTLRVTYRTHGAGDRTLTLMLPDVDDNGSPWETDVIFPESTTIITHDIAAVPFPNLPAVKTRFKQAAGQNGNVTIESMELVV